MTTRHVENRLAEVEQEMEALHRRLDDETKALHRRVDGFTEATKADVTRTLGSVRVIREAITETA